MQDFSPRHDSQSNAFDSDVDDHRRDRSPPARDVANGSPSDELTFHDAERLPSPKLLAEVDACWHNASEPQSEEWIDDEANLSAEADDAESETPASPAASAEPAKSRIERQARPSRKSESRRNSAGPYPRITWLMFLMALMLIVRYFVPGVAREISYGVTQGRQRAQHEFATVALKDSPLAELSRAYQLISQRVGPSVVHINVAVPARAAEESLGPFASFHESRGQGSGVIVDRDGHIVTNQHVIDGAESITVSMGDGRKLRAMVVGVDPLTDLAVLRVPADNLIPADWGSSDELEVGSLVFAVGSPFGLEHSVTSGIVSAKNRSGKAGRTYQDFLQTDAAVNPGNSGGPLFDVSGRLVGINTAIVGESYRGVSFAIPSSVAQNVFERLVRDGAVAHGWLGVQLVDLDDEQSERLGTAPRAGAYVAGFVDDPEAGPSPARLAGLQAGDIVLQWDTRAVGNRAELSRLVAQSDAGATARLTVERNGEQVAVDVQLGQRPSRFN